MIRNEKGSAHDFRYKLVKKRARGGGVDPLCPIFPLCLDPFCLGASTKEIKRKKFGTFMFFRYCLVSVPVERYHPLVP